MRLPDTYYPADSATAPDPPRRAPSWVYQTALSFAASTGTYKIEPEIFDIWMRLLQRVDGSVLWLFAENDTARHNLRAEAEARGVHGDRLAFAGRVGHAESILHVCNAPTCSWTPCRAMRTQRPSMRYGRVCRS